MKRRTCTIEEDLYKEVKINAKKEGRTVKKQVDHILKNYYSKEKSLNANKIVFKMEDVDD